MLHASDPPKLSTQPRPASFFLPYEAMRTSADPDAALREFLQSTYDAAADAGQWDRAALECPRGVPRAPRAL